MGAVATGAEALDAYLASMASAATREKYRKGIQKVTENPMLKAAEAEQDYLDGIMLSVSSGKRRRALEAASFEGWKQNSAGAGADRLGSGAKKAQAKMGTIFNKMAPVWKQQRDAARAIKRSDDPDGVIRFAAAVKIMKQHAATI